MKMPLVSAYSRNLGQRMILARKGIFWKKSTKPNQPPHPSPYSASFLSVMHQNKALDNFCKRGQHSIAERDIGLEYAQLVVSNFHIATTSHPLWKNVNFAKSFVLSMPMIMFSKALRYCFQKSWPTQQ